jgi:carnitine 3-dehydrogenase
LSGEGKKMHLFHRIFGSNDELAATCEILLLHMNLKTRCTSLPDRKVAVKLNTYAKTHADILMPCGAGRYVGQKKGRLSTCPGADCLIPE